MMKQKSFFVQGNLNFALIEIISSFQYLFFATDWTAKFTENIGLLAISVLKTLTGYRPYNHSENFY